MFDFKAERVLKKYAIVITWTDQNNPHKMHFTHKVLSLVQFLNAVKAISSMRLFCKYLKEKDKTNDKVANWRWKVDWKWLALRRLIVQTCNRIFFLTYLLVQWSTKSLGVQTACPLGEEGGGYFHGKKLWIPVILLRGCKSWILVPFGVFRTKRHCLLRLFVFK